MSVLIKGMEKPEHCGYCRFRYDGICHALQKTQYSMDECPIVPLIRCKDCKHLEYGYCEKLEMRPEDKFFCGYSERKDE